MSTFTSSLPDALLTRLNEAAKELQLPKNKLIERALDIYLDQLKRAQYAASYDQAGKDDEIMSIAEEGMADYLIQVNSADETR
ncbi:ribbon-helix-helix domain-containing protein [Reichenbachiella sp.]|uniref:ribbon-helix-helix domain-containing protein n=1 Tax=Reichenbachiella sp. TaxID=2184521 RepID=UPI003B5B98D2